MKHDIPYEEDTCGDISALIKPLMFTPMGVWEDLTGRCLDFINVAFPVGDIRQTRWNYSVGTTNKHQF